MTYICRCNAEFGAVADLDRHQEEAHGLFVKEVTKDGFRILGLGAPRPPPRVLNIKDSGGQVPLGAVYVARPTAFGNPFIIGKHGTREEVIAKYREHLLASPELLARIGELRGRDLCCFCAPLDCHARILLEMANAPEAPR